MRKRLWLASILIVASLTVAAWGGRRLAVARQFRAKLDQVKQEIAAGQYGRAHKRLSELSASRDDSGEVDYQLGICELYRGSPDRALAAWKRVAPGGPFGARAALQSGMLALSTGQLSRAEEIFQSALKRGAGRDASSLWSAMQLLYHVEGRTDEVRRALIASWPDADAPADVLKQLSRLNVSPLPLESTRRTLDKGAGDDDRVWLARANLAIRTGQFQRAAEWLDACERRRPRDTSVGRARFELARATEDVDGVWSALEILPPDALSPVDLLRLRAWLATRSGDVAAERTALTSLVELEPGDITALDRLIAIVGPDGDGSEIARLRSKKIEMTAALQQYRALMKGDSIGDPAELAWLAQALGRTVESRGWSLIRDGDTNRRGPDRPGLLPADATGPIDPSSAHLTLADRCADLRHRRAHAGSVALAPGVLPHFVDGATSAGLRFVQNNGGTALKRLPETMSGGVGLLDYDGDGWLDIYAVQGGPFPPAENSTSEDRLFKNRGDGIFVDVTESAGLARLAGGFGHGVAVGDYDNDGRPDLFLTRWRSYRLLHNRGNGLFEDVTAPANLGGDRDWPTSAAWADLDGDGDLDLYVCHYLDFDIKTARVCFDTKARVNHYCSPRNFAALADHVFRNDGGRFVDVTAGAGFVDPDGRGLGVVAADLDDDNLIDLYVANDMSANYLFHNAGRFRFEETAFQAGAAANSSGKFQSGMGIACGDLDGDGRPDLAVTNYYGESTTLFHNVGGGLFADYTTTSGLTAPTRPLLGFGISFLDANNDARLDVLSANGHVSNFEPIFPWKMPAQLLTGGVDGRVSDASARAGAPFGLVHLGRGLASGDIDNDGRVDAVISAQNEPLIFLHNQTANPGHWLTVRLEGVRSNRDGVGARVVIEAGGRRQVQQRIGGGSYQSASDPRLHFGLHDSAQVDRLEVRWPSGQIDRFDGLAADHGYLLREGAQKPVMLPGRDRRPA